MYSARTVANYVINWSHDNNAEITNLRLQKLLYFLQGEMCAATGERLIEDDFEAWKLGPVIPDIYRDFSVYSSFDIPRQMNSKGNIAENDAKEMDKILEKYKKYTTWALVERSHAEDPWYSIYDIFGEDTEIPFELIKSYYTKEI